MSLLIKVDLDATDGTARFPKLVAWLERNGASMPGPIDIWWRDDDAVDSTPELDVLIALSERQRVPVLLSVIPDAMRPGLVQRLRDAGPDVLVAQHGFDHKNRGQNGPSEFPINRDLKEVAAKLQEGRMILEDAFGDRFLPILVPPWNNFPRIHVRMLKEMGYFGLSTSNGLVPIRSFEMDVHVDFLTWKSPDPVWENEAVFARTIASLERACNKGGLPIGVMSHHLQMGEPEAWRNLAAYFALMRDCPWLQIKSPRAIFALPDHAIGRN